MFGFLATQIGVRALDAEHQFLAKVPDRIDGGLFVVGFSDVVVECHPIERRELANIRQRPQAAFRLRHDFTDLWDFQLKLFLDFGVLLICKSHYVDLLSGVVGAVGA
ncbi:hypothetical protein C7I85_29435 [Mesorhizobium soli]|uniref:Uncharacterized protein n=1 Tax=Pseudaminobacter soli (ex Li et al. 2025) TaxID=1295366 RepID=A0A2P7RMI1_9HYPH|nr:hypothetical protein C7I85_29435 [Mesorhizobium soli]